MLLPVQDGRMVSQFYTGQKVISNAKTWCCSFIFLLYFSTESEKEKNSIRSVVGLGLGGQ
jgi:hypothetical protein